MKSFMLRLKSALPGVFIHSIQIGDSPSADLQRSFFDNADRQVDEVCEQLAGIPELQDGFNAIGFSQGGQLMRAVLQRCAQLPPVWNLITIGAQHSGIADLPGCTPTEPIDSDYFSENLVATEEVGGMDMCASWKRLVKLGLYHPLIRSRVIQAQFFKDPARLDQYVKYNRFLQDINNEGENKNAEYKKKILTLRRFVMFKFEQENAVVPPDSSWFGWYGDSVNEVLPVERLPIYQEDWIGLKTLDERGNLIKRIIKGRHMSLPEDFIADLAQYLKD